MLWPLKYDTPGDMFFTLFCVFLCQKYPFLVLTTRGGWWNLMIGLAITALLADEKAVALDEEVTRDGTSSDGRVREREGPIVAMTTGAKIGFLATAASLRLVFLKNIHKFNYGPREHFSV
jgi:hypothetical protein